MISPKKSEFPVHGLICYESTSFLLTNDQTLFKVLPVLRFVVVETREVTVLTGTVVGVVKSSTKRIFCPGYWYRV